MHDSITIGFYNNWSFLFETRNKRIIHRMREKEEKIDLIFLLHAKNSSERKYNNQLTQYTVHGMCIWFPYIFTIFFFVFLQRKGLRNKVLLSVDMMENEWCVKLSNILLTMKNVEKLLWAHMYLDISFRVFGGCVCCSFSYRWSVVCHLMGCLVCCWLLALLVHS